MSVAVESQLSVLRDEEVELITDLALKLKSLSSLDEGDYQRLLEIARDLREMFFLVVVIGEFNAGKSSFINAILGDELLPIGITPTTEHIELIRFSEQTTRNPNVREDGLREWGHPNTGADGVAIVDTPGTGSVFAKHGETAKAFLHRSDLVIFVISAKRAFADTERLYLQLARDYGKKVILVVNQVDLLQQSEKQEVRRFIESQIKETLGIEPLIFMVSAKDSVNDPAGGGIAAVRAHLRGVYSEMLPAQQKLLSQLDTTSRLLDKYVVDVKKKADLVGTDISKVKTVQNELQKQSISLEAQMKEAGASIDTVFEGIRRRGIDFIDSNLNLRKIGRAPSREKLQAEFQDVVIGHSLREINDATTTYINSVVDQSRLYWRNVIDRLNQLRDLMDNEVGGVDTSVYAEQRESLQNAIRIAESELKSYSTGQVVAEMKEVFSANMTMLRTSALAGFGGLVIAILGIATPGPLVGVAAAPLALPAVIIGAPIAAIGGYATYRYIRRISRETKKAFHKRVDELVVNYHQALDEVTTKERNRLNSYGAQVLTPIFTRLDTMAEQYREQLASLVQVQEQIADLRGRITELD